MAMTDVGNSSLEADSQCSLVEGWLLPGTDLHLSYEPGELFQWLYS